MIFKPYSSKILERTHTFLKSTFNLLNQDSRQCGKWLAMCRAQEMGKQRWLVTPRINLASARRPVEALWKGVPAPRGCPLREPGGGRGCGAVTAAYLGSRCIFPTRTGGRDRRRRGRAAVWVPVTASASVSAYFFFWQLTRLQVAF